MLHVRETKKKKLEWSLGAEVKKRIFQKLTRIVVPAVGRHNGSGVITESRRIKMASQIADLEKQGKISAQSSMIVPLDGSTFNTKTRTTSNAIKGGEAKDSPKLHMPTTPVISETNELLKAVQKRNAAISAKGGADASTSAASAGASGAGSTHSVSDTKASDRESTSSPDRRMDTRGVLTSPVVDPMKLAFKSDMPRREKTRSLQKARDNNKKTLRHTSTKKFTVSCSSHNRRRQSSRKSSTRLLGGLGDRVAQSFSTGIFPEGSKHLKSILSMQVLSLDTGVDEEEEDESEGEDDSRKASITADDDLTVKDVDLEKRVSLTKQLGLSRPKSSVMPATRGSEKEKAKTEKRKKKKSQSKGTAKTT